MEHHRAFNPVDDLPENFLLLMYGVRRCGKSTMLEHMLYTMRKRLKDYKVYLFSSTASVDKDQYQYIPPDFKFTKIKKLDDELAEILEDQETLLTSLKGEARKKAEERNRILIIMDDCVSEKIVRTSENLGYLAVAGRHVAVSVIILSQVIAGSGSVPPIVRTQADAIIMCTCPRSENERDLLITQYMSAEAGNKNSKSQALTLLDGITRVQYRCMVVGAWDPSARRTKEYIFHYGPAPFPPSPEGFRLGRDDQWRAEAEEGVETGEGKNTYDESREDEGAEPPDGGNDVNGGTGTRAKGISHADMDVRKLTTRRIMNQLAPTYSNLPPALRGGNSGKKMRSFVAYSAAGGAGSGESDGSTFERKVAVASGWTNQKPYRKRKTEIKHELKPRSNRKIAKFGNLKSRNSGGANK